MTSLFISKHPLQTHTPQNRRLGTYENNDQRFWTCGIIPPEQFILNTYHFEKYIFFLDYNDLLFLEKWDIAWENIDIIIWGCTDEANIIDALFYIGTDYNLNIHVFFYDTIEEYLELKF